MVDRSNDLTGQIFGRFVVISREPSKKGDRFAKWFCKCQCGNTKIVKAASLVSGATKSCGCLYNETRHLGGKSNARDLTGLKFTRLLVIEKTESRTPNGDIKWKCVCDCGKEIKVSSHYLLSKDTKSCGCLNKEVSSKKLKLFHKSYRQALGKDCNINITTTSELVRRTLKSSGLHIKVFNRDNYTCVLCNTRGKKLNAHHIEPFSLNNEKQLDETNMITLCEYCHAKAHNNKKWKTINKEFQNIFKVIIILLYDGYTI